METFQDLVFKQHPNSPCFDKQATIKFDNGYGISVITGRHAYCGDGTYEVAIMRNDDLCYDTDITDDVLGHQSPSDIDTLLVKVKAL